MKKIEKGGGAGFLSGDVTTGLLCKFPWPHHKRGRIK